MDEKEFVSRKQIRTSISSEQFKFLFSETQISNSNSDGFWLESNQLALTVDFDFANRTFLTFVTQTVLKSTLQHSKDRVNLKLNSFLECTDTELEDLWSSKRLEIAEIEPRTYQSRVNHANQYTITMAQTHFYLSNVKAET